MICKITIERGNKPTEYEIKNILIPALLSTDYVIIHKDELERLRKIEEDHK